MKSFFMDEVSSKDSPNRAGLQNFGNSQPNTSVMCTQVIVYPMSKTSFGQHTTSSTENVLIQGTLSSFPATTKEKFSQQEQTLHWSELDLLI